MLPSFQKDVLPAHKRSNIVYKYLSHCDSVYVGRTSQRLEERIRQHIPKFIRNQVKPKRSPYTSLQIYSKCNHFGFGFGFWSAFAR